MPVLKPKMINHVSFKLETESLRALMVNDPAVKNFIMLLEDQANIAINGALRQRFSTNPEKVTIQ